MSEQKLSHRFHRYFSRNDFGKEVVVRLKPLKSAEVRTRTLGFEPYGMIGSQIALRVRTRTLGFEPYGMIESQASPLGFEHRH